MFPYRAASLNAAKPLYTQNRTMPVNTGLQKGEFERSDTRLGNHPYLLLLLSLILCSCVQSHENTPEMIFSGRTFATTGEIVHVDLREKRVQIAHGDIEGFMEAMTMWFETEEPAARMLRNLKRGDRVRFELKEVTNGPSVIFKIYLLH